MKQLVKLMTLAALASLFVLSCGKKDNTPDTKPEKPVVTADMYSVNADAESGVVVFKFTANGLSPFWTVVEPGGNKTTFTDREVSIQVRIEFYVFTVPSAPSAPNKAKN